jgi:hypothetical protein
MIGADLFLKDFKSFIVEADIIAKIQTIPTGTAVFLTGLLIAAVLLYGETKNRWEWKLFPYHVGKFSIGIIFFLQGIIDSRMFHYDGDVLLLVVTLAWLIYFVLINIAITAVRILLTDIGLRLIDGKNYEFDQHGNIKISYKYWELVTLFWGWVLFNEFIDPFGKIVINKVQSISTGAAVFLAGLLLSVALLSGTMLQLSEAIKNRSEWKLFPYLIGIKFLLIALFIQLIKACLEFQYDGYLSLVVGPIELLLYCIFFLIAGIIVRIPLVIFFRLIDGENNKFHKIESEKISYKYGNLLNFFGGFIIFYEYKDSFGKIIHGWF